MNEPPKDAPGSGEDPRRAQLAFGLLLGGLVTARLTVSAHAPDASDAGFLLAFGLLVAAAAVADRALAFRAPLRSTLALALALLLSAPGSWHPLISFLALPAALAAVAAFLAVTSLGERARAPALLGLLAGGALSSTVALTQRFLIWPDALRRREELGLEQAIIERMLANRPIGLSLSPDLMSALALAGLVAGLALLAVKSPLQRAGAIFLMALCVLGVVVSRSAGGALATGAFFAFWMLLVVLRGLRPGVALLALVGALAVPAALVALLGRGAAQLGRSAGERLLNWQVGLEVLERHPWWGVGFGRFSDAYLGARPPEANVTRYAHSFFVQTLVEGGVLLGGLVLLLIAAALLLFVRARLRGRPDRSRDVVLAGALALLLRAAFDYDLEIGATAGSFAVLLAVAWLDARRGGPVLGELVLPVTSRRRSAVMISLIACFLLTGLTALLVGSYREAVLAPFARGSTASEDDVARLLAYGDRLPSDPHAAAATSGVWLTRLSRCAGECPEVVDEARRFVDVERRHPPPHVALLDAELARRAGDDEGAQRALARALAEDPGFAPAHARRLRWAREDDDPRLAAFAAEAKRWARAR